MNEKPRRREIREGIAFEDATKVSFDVSRSGKACVVTDEPQMNPVSAHAPERAFSGSEPVLQGRGGRTAAPIRSQMRAGAVEVVSGRDHHERDTPPETLQCDCKLAVTHYARAHAVNIREPEHLSKKLLNKIHSRRRRRCLGHRQFSEHGLADTEVPRNLVP